MEVLRVEMNRRHLIDLTYFSKNEPNYLIFRYNYIFSFIEIPYQISMNQRMMFYITNDC